MVLTKSARFGIVGAVVTFVFIFSFTTDSVGQTTSNSARQIEEIVLGIKSRNDFLDPMLLKYSTNTKATSKWVRVIPDAYPSEGTAKEWRTDYTIAVSSGRRWETKTEYDENRKGQHFLLFNGKGTVWPHQKLNCFNIANGPPSFHICRTPTNLSGEESLQLALEQSLKGGPQVTVQRLTRDGEALTVTIKHQQSGWTNELRFLPEKSYAIQSLSIRDEDGQLLSHLQVFDFGAADQAYYPMKGRVEKYMVPANRYGAKPQQIVDFSVEKLSTDRRDIPDNTFIYPFPDGSQFYDTDLSLWVRDVDLAESHLDKVVGELRGDSQTLPWYYWMGISAIALVLVGGIVRYWRSSIVNLWGGTS